MSETAQAPEALKAFVISPIGELGSPERVHADWVLETIIRAACERAKSATAAITADRSEHAKRPGDIMEQVVEALIHDRIVFAVLAYDRPNVYYELALANAAGRHVIMLRHDREKTHFDVAGLRAITYSYPMQGAELDGKIAEVAEYIRTVVKQEAFKPTVFKDLNPLGRFYREYDFKEKFRDIDMPSYSAIFTAASSFIGLQGISLRHFAQHQFLWNTPDGKEVSFFDLVRSKVLFDAVSVHIVMLHPDNRSLPHLFKFADRAGYSKALANAREEIRTSIKEWSELQDELEARSPERADGRKGSLRVTPLMHGTVNYRLTLTDRQAVLSPYFNIFPYNSAGPALVCANTTIIYDRLKKEFFDRIVSEERAAAALTQHGSLEITPVPKAG